MIELAGSKQITVEETPDLRRVLSCYSVVKVNVQVQSAVPGTKLPK